jgi:hypothetical protein
MMSEVRKLLGNTIANYFWGSNYGENLLLERAATRGP